MRYIALLRGINVGGNNKVPMAELRAAFEQLGFERVSTYINSGNVFFDTEAANDEKLIATISQQLRKSFGFDIITMVISVDELRDALQNVPNWWGLPGTDKHNAIFVIAPVTPADIEQVIGAAKPEYEKIKAHGQVIFWTAPFKTFNRTRYSKIVGTSVYKSITIRNANTTRKLLELADA